MTAGLRSLLIRLAPPDVPVYIGFRLRPRHFAEIANSTPQTTTSLPESAPVEH